MSEKCRTLVVQHGAYSVWHDKLVHLPWGLYRIYKGDEYVGGQISYPSQSDCEWLDRRRGVYADAPDPRDGRYIFRRYRINRQDKLAA